MTPEFNAWWNEGEITTDNPYEAGSPAFWAWEGWQAGVKIEQERCRKIVQEAFDETWSGTEAWELLDRCISKISSKQ